ncbi:uncharacterized protein LY89DRAFT_579809 [Mollisia scopiformis]|uniref:Zn(2)-C6 fungal-type domain-containing protein n=1 Tax=Mollisia scopiformis TaxID=149040 RepID=A0A194XIA4_MOLSC|nr:uncharacterized protein LY89DRAFT_579809 [Mollisia scopiformis]KUJ19893.1 hypothetical protein LY89DRAFT_579809 [Mollisia scopiformis]
MNQQGPKSASEQTTNRACDHCRNHKVRCLPNPSGPSKICQRCARTDRECVYTAPQKRKQRKRTDTRVAELEREVQAMRSLFDRKTNSESPGTAQTSNRSEARNTGNGFHQVRTNNSAPSSNGPPSETPASWMEEYSEAYPREWSPPPFNLDSDVVDRGIVSMDDANRLFQSYNEDLVPHYPGVIFPAELTADELRKTKPTLFLSVIAAAAAKTDSHLYSILNSEVLSAYAHRTVIRGEKNMELVQAMIVTSIWYFPPGKFAQLKFYEYIHMATTMALDIGLGKNPKSSRLRRGIGLESEGMTTEPLDEKEMEKRKTFLVCYLISTGVSMSMRRPNMLRWNSWIGDCLETLERNSQASKWDHLLAAWVRILKITEEVGATFAFDDCSNMADLSEPRVQLTMTGLQKVAEAWKRNLPCEVFDNDALRLQYYHTQLYIHEIALHDDHPPEDFQPPFSITKVLSIHTDPRASNSYIDAISISIASAQAVVDILLNMDVEALRALPVYNYVRMSYALITLIKLYVSSKSPQSKIGAVLDPASLKVGIYLKSTIDKLIKAVGPRECRAPFTFLGMLMRLHGWYKSQEKEQYFSIPVVPKQEDECWLPPVPRIQWDPDAKKPLHGKDIPFGPKHPGWQPYSIPSEELENLDFGERPDVGDENQMSFDPEVLNNFQYESLGDVDQFLMIGSGHGYIPGDDNWYLTEDALPSASVNNPYPNPFGWVQNGSIHNSS